MNLPKLIELFKKSEDELYNFLLNELNKYYNNILIDWDRTYIVAVGEVPIVLVAHLDTVFPKPPKRFFSLKMDKSKITSPSGLGADDRAGVYAILDILEQGLRPSIVFTCGEEKGGIGVKNLIKDIPKDITHSNCIIELDRQGSMEAVYYDCANFEFEDFISEFGFETEFGTFSDISYLAPAWGIAAVNLSVGYYFEHSYQEVLDIKELDLTIQKVCDIINSKPKRYEYVEDEPNWVYFCNSCISGNCYSCEKLKEIGWQPKVQL